MKSKVHPQKDALYLYMDMLLNPHVLMPNSGFMSLAGMERAAGINQKQPSNYLNHRAVPRRKQANRIISGIHRFAKELLSITL